MRSAGNIFIAYRTSILACALWRTASAAFIGLEIFSPALPALQAFRFSPRTKLSAVSKGFVCRPWINSVSRD
jgi:hypothetical protein